MEVTKECGKFHSVAIYLVKLMQSTFPNTVPSCKCSYYCKNLRFELIFLIFLLCNFIASYVSYNGYSDVKVNQ